MHALTELARIELAPALRSFHQLMRSTAFDGALPRAAGETRAAPSSPVKGAGLVADREGTNEFCINSLIVEQLDLF